MGFSSASACSRMTASKHASTAAASSGGALELAPATPAVAAAAVEALAAAATLASTVAAMEATVALALSATLFKVLPGCADVSPMAACDESFGAGLWPGMGAGASEFAGEREAGTRNSLLSSAGGALSKGAVGGRA